MANMVHKWVFSWIYCSWSCVAKKAPHKVPPCTMAGESRIKQYAKAPLIAINFPFPPSIISIYQHNYSLLSCHCISLYFSSYFLLFSPSLYPSRVFVIPIILSFILVSLQWFPFFLSFLDSNMFVLIFVLKLQLRIFSFFRRSGWELLCHGIPNPARPLEEVCGPQGRLMVKN